MVTACAASLGFCLRNNAIFTEPELRLTSELFYSRLVRQQKTLVQIRRRGKLGDHWRALSWMGYDVLATTRRCRPDEELAEALDDAPGSSAVDLTLQDGANADNPIDIEL